MAATFLLITPPQRDCMSLLAPNTAAILNATSTTHPTVTNRTYGAREEKRAREGEKLESGAIAATFSSRSLRFRI